jgi:thiol-disulfide isomerase/thioredoxin
MKKKILFITLLLSVVGLVAWISTKISGRIQHKKQVAIQLKTLPMKVKSLGLDSGMVNLEQFVENKPVVIFFFDPDCEHCQSEAQVVKKNAEAFAGVQLLWVSMAQFYRLRAFEHKYGLEKTIPNLRIAQISPQEADQQFGFRTVPTILIYNAEHQLTKQYVGETKVEAILKNI